MIKRILLLSLFCCKIFGAGIAFDAPSSEIVSNSTTVYTVYYTNSIPAVTNGTWAVYTNLYATNYSGITNGVATYYVPTPTNYAGMFFFASTSNVWNIVIPSNVVQLDYLPRPLTLRFR